MDEKQIYLTPKYDIRGKTLVISDIHIGLKKANSSRLSIVVKVFKNFLNTIKKEQVKNVICCGDIFHSRVSLDLQALNIGIKLVSALAEHCKCYLILGNHDLYYKNNVEINSSNIFRSNSNIEIVSEPTIVSLNGAKTLLVPWLSDLSKFPKNYFDLMFGHFGIDDKYLIASYIEEHLSAKPMKPSEITAELIRNDSLLNEVGKAEDFSKDIEKSKDSNTNDLVGDFIELAKIGGTIFAGHIHEHKEFVAKKRNFVFIGSPYQQNFGEIYNKCGYYLLNESNEKNFIETVGVPKHVLLKISEIVSGGGIDGYDFSIVKGNIVKKVYDIDVLKSDEMKINQRINDSLPFEEALPEYMVANSVDENVVDSEVLDMIKKSKLEYIKNYIASMDDSIFETSNLSKDTLFEKISEYYEKATEQL